MQYRSLGRTGIRVSPYALGTIMLSSIGNPDRGEAVRIIHKALDSGINFVDSSDTYGDAEDLLGEALQGRRENVVVATKVGRPAGDDPNMGGNSRRWITRAVEASLRRLRTDWIDVYQIHRRDDVTGIDEVLSVLSDLVRAGKIRAFGTSSMPASDIVEAHWAAERLGLMPPHTEQPAYSILSRGIEAEVLPVTQRYGMGVLVWSPLAMGQLTGRVRKGQDNDLSRGARYRHMSDERRLDVVEQLIPLAEQAGLPMTHLAMAFAIAHPGVTSAIAGPRTMAHLDDLLAGADVALSDDLLDQIDKIVPPGTDVGVLDMAYRSPAQLDPYLRRRPQAARSAA